MVAGSAMTRFLTSSRYAGFLTFGLFADQTRALVNVHSASFAIDRPKSINHLQMFLDYLYL